MPRRRQLASDRPLGSLPKKHSDLRISGSVRATRSRRRSSVTVNDGAFRIGPCPQSRSTASFPSSSGFRGDSYNRRVKFRRRSTESTLEAAAALVAKEKQLEAIDLLTRENRRARDIRIEEQLVELRYQAFAQASHPSERPVQPETVKDLFPGAVVPEIGAASLTVAAVRSAILCHGS